LGEKVNEKQQEKNLAVGRIKVYFVENIFLEVCT
jgi:hypothetical protein